jgi:L-alanine-DL-glutamate epimerase-like enolase superfamily enzyme
MPQFPFPVQPGAAPVVSLRFHRLSYPIVVPFSIALESLPVAEIVIVTCTDSEGRTGVGEAAPFPRLTFDTADKVVSVLAGALTDFERLDPQAGLLRLYESATDWRRSSVSAFCALESALFDLTAKQRSQTLARLYGTAGVQAVETDITLPIMPAANVPEFHQLFSSYGFITIKVKVSGNVSADLDLVHAVVRLFPAGTRITLDGNQGFDVERAVRIVAELERAGINPIFFEQPLPEGDWHGTAQLASRLPIPVCLDESVRLLPDLQRVIADNLPVMINLKIMKSGLSETVALHRLARSRGITMMIGGMLESPVAMSHSLHLACGLGGVRYFDLDTPFFFQGVPTGTNPWSPRRARLTLPDGEGICLDLDPGLV